MEFLKSIIDLTYACGGKIIPITWTCSGDKEPFRFFTENGDLVIVYDKYTIAPGSMGNPAFTIPKSVYEPLLK